MAELIWDAVWERARAGKHTVVTRAGPIPPAPSDLKLLRVNCDTALTMGEPLQEARRQLERLLGRNQLESGQAPAQREKSLRSRMLGDVAPHPIDAVFVEECNRLANWTDGHGVLFFESFDTADTATIETIVEVLRRPGWLRLPLVFAFRGEAAGPVAALVDVLRRSDADDGILAGGSDRGDAALSPPFEWMGLPADVLCVVRAGAVIGADFDAGLVARMLDEPIGSVLRKLQVAADAGAPLADRGEGRFSLAPEAITMLKGRMLPSLLAFWHEQLGRLLGGRRGGGESLSSATPADDAGKLGPRQGRAEARPDREEGLSGALPEETDRTVAPADAAVNQEADALAAMFESSVSATSPAAVSPTENRSNAAQTELSPERAQTAVPRDAEWGARPGTQESRQDQARAAAHLNAAGQTEAAVEQYLDAIQQAFARGDARRAYLLDQEALKLLDQLPTSSRRALLRARLLLERGRLQWQGAVLGAPFTLQDALESLDAARSSLPAEPPLEMMGQLAGVRAGVCYDLGDLDSLQRALDELTDVSRQLLGAGKPTLAARLLNDQAAVYVRLGDPVRATHLLSKSRQLFDRLLGDKPEDVLALEELAEANHLLARIPLHARIRPGREEDAYALCLDHALAAERTYGRLGQHRELARVWETMGRLEMGRGRFQAARQRLSDALELQKRMGDVTGLARSTAALADLFVSAERLEEAVELLAESIELNLEKGSPIGLAFNRRAYESLLPVGRQASGPAVDKLRDALDGVRRRLADAESVLGRLVLPGERDEKDRP